MQWYFPDGIGRMVKGCLRYTVYRRFLLSCNVD